MKQQQPIQENLRLYLSYFKHNRNSEETIVHKVLNRQRKFQRQMENKDLPKKRSNGEFCLFVLQGNNVLKGRAVRISSHWIPKGLV